MGCPTWGCGENGTQLTGIAGQPSDDSERFEGNDGSGCPEWGCGSNGTRVDGRAVDAEQPTVTTITLPTGEVFDLR
jgi:hypothetical protein